MAPSTGTICRIARKNKKTKSIAITDNILPHESRPGDKFLTRYFTKSIDGFIAMSKSVFNNLDIFTNKQPKRLTPHPIYDHYGEIIPKQAAKEKLLLNPDYNYLLFFGFIREYKGLDLLLEALTQKKLKQFANLKLIIAGEFYSNEEKYLNLIKKYNLENKIILRTDYIPEDQVNLFFCASDLITQPYKAATQSGVTQISYHFHKPMLVTNVGGLPEIVEDQKCGYVVEPNPEAISSAIYDFYMNKRENEMINEVIKAKEKFSWKNLTQTIFDVYNLWI
jgi:D-inositol-3-phosphate glycosyltransferase